MLAKVIISIQTGKDEPQEPSSQRTRVTPVNSSPNHWQFSTEQLSTGNLIDLLLHLESLGFDTNA